MNLALFHFQPPGGGAMRVLAEYVRRSDHEMTLYTRKPERKGLLELDPKVRVHRLPWTEPTNDVARIRDLWAYPRYGREAAAAIDAGGHDAVFVHVNDTVQAPEVLPFLRTPSLYYAPEPLRAFSEPEPEFGRLTNVKARLTRAGINPYELKRKRLNDRHIGGADLVVTHSHWTASELERVHGVRAEVVPLGVDAETFAPRPVEREGFVLAVGALHPLKGHQFVIEALATLPQPRPKLVLVGDRGHLEGPLIEHARTLGVELDLRQQLPFADLLDLYRRAGVLACGQLREPFGLTPLEAMGTCTPVVAVAEGGFLETVKDGETGILAPRDPQAFGAAIAKLLADPQAAADMARRGREDVVANWNWDRTVRGYDALLERVAARSS